jgi:PmbA protein
VDEERALKYLMRRVDAAEIYFTEEVSNRLVFKKGEFDVFEWSKTQGYGVRVIRKKRIGFVFSNTLDEDVLDRAVKISRISREDENLTLPDKQAYGGFRPPVDERIVWEELDGAMDKVRELLAACEPYSVTPTIAGLSWSVGREMILNSLGVEAEERDTYCTCYVTVVARDNGAATASEHESSRSLDIDFAAVGEKAARLAKESLGARKLDTGTYDVVLRPNAAAELLEEMLIPSFSAENVAPGRSYLAGKEGERVFDNLTVVDDGRLRSGLNTSAFDAEGVATRRTPLVDNGILKGYLYNTYYAAMSDKTSTGNSLRSSHSALPGIWASNMIVTGKGGLEEDELVVHGLMGTHTGNAVSGDFSVETRNAFYRGMPVKRMILVGNIFELLNNIKGYGRDVKQVSSVVTPSIEFSDVKVAG